MNVFYHQMLRPARSIIGYKKLLGPFKKKRDQMISLNARNIYVYCNLILKGINDVLKNWLLFSPKLLQHYNANEADGVACKEASE